MTELRAWDSVCRQDRILPFLRLTTSLPRLTSLRLTKVHLSRLPAAALAQAVLNTPHVEIDPLNHSLSPYQATVLLTTLASHPRPLLTHLSLLHCSLTQAPAHLLATTVAKLTSFSALWVELTQEQVVAMITALAAHDSKLRSLVMPDYYTAEVATRAVDPAILVEALASLETLTYGCHVPPQLWPRLARGETRLRSLTVQRRFLMDLSPTVLAGAINILKQVDFEQNFPEDEGSEYVDCFTRDQVKEVFEQMAKKTNLKKVSLEISEENILNHLELPNGLFAQALVNVEDLTIHVKNEPHFYPELEELMILCTKPSKNHKLKRLSISVSSTSGHKFCLPSSLVSDVVLQVGEVRLIGCIDV